MVVGESRPRAPLATPQMMRILQAVKVGINLFSVADFNNHNDHSVAINFVDNAIIPTSDFMKSIVPLHLGCAGVWQDVAQLFNFAFNP